MFSRPYIFQKVSYGRQGSKFTIRKAPYSYSFYAAAVFVGVSSWIFLSASSAQLTEPPTTVVLLVLALLLLYMINSSTYSESVLVLSSVGVTLEVSSVLGTSSKYFDIHHIEDIVIVEAITMQSIIFQIVLLPAKDSKPPKKMHILFKHFRPTLEHLKQIYQDAQTKLILPYQTTARVR